MTFSSASMIESHTASAGAGAGAARADGDPRRRAHLVVASAHGVVEIDLDGARFVGVLEVPGPSIGVGDAMALKLLCRADNAYPYVVDDPQDLAVQVLAVEACASEDCAGEDCAGEETARGEEPAGAGAGQPTPMRPGLGLWVAVLRPQHACVASHHVLAPPPPPTRHPVVVGGSLDEALENMLADQLEPDSDIIDRATLAGDDDDPDVITGSLRRLPLAELVQAMSLARKTAAIHLRLPGGVGVIYLDDGEVACAQLDDDPRRAVARGVSAFTRLLACERGSFRVSFEKEWHERNVHCSTQMLLLDGLRQLDESRRPQRPLRHDDAPDPMDEQADGETHTDAGHDGGRRGECETARDDADAFVELEELPVRPAMRSATRAGSGGASVAGFSGVLAAPRSSTR